MRTLHLLASADRRGAEVFGVELAGALHALGEQEVVALAPTAQRGGGLDVDVVPALHRPAAMAELRRRAAAADVILGHGSKGLVGASISSALSRTPFVYRSIGDPTFWGSSWARRTRVGVQLRRAAAVGALWPAAAAVIRDRYRLDPDRVHVLPNAVPEARFRPPTGEDRAKARAELGLPEDAPVVAYVGALSPEKRFALVARSVALVPGAWLVVAGDGPEREHVAEVTADALAGRHVLLGSVPDVTPVLHAADVLVLLSETEGQPGVVIEAGLCALPTVAADVGGIGSVVVHDRTGLLVPDPEPATAAVALELAIERREALGAAARERCEAEFTLGVVAERWARVLTDAAGSP